MASLVFGGPLEQIYVKGRTAQVIFLHAKDCQKYYDATANGVDYTFEDQQGVAQVAKGADVDVVSGQARTFIELGFTRCIRATDIGNDYTIAKLKEKAAYKGRSVQDVTIGTNESGVSMNWRNSRYIYCIAHQEYSSHLRSSVSATFATRCSLNSRSSGKKNGRAAISTLALTRELNPAKCHSWGGVLANRNLAVPKTRECFAPISNRLMFSLPQSCWWMGIFLSLFGSIAESQHSTVNNLMPWAVLPLQPLIH